MAQVVTPDIRQSETTECGLAALVMVLNHYGCPVTLEQLRRQTGSTRLGVTARQLVDLARRYGMQAQAFRKAPQDLAALGLPLLVHSQFVHFQVVEAVTAHHVRVNDPAAGPMLLRHQDFALSFTGIVLRIRPPQGAKRQKPPPGLPARLLRRLAASWPGLSAALALSVAGCACATAAALLAAGDGATAAALAITAATAFAGRRRVLARVGRAQTRQTLGQAADALPRQSPHWFAHRSSAHIADSLRAGIAWPARLGLGLAVTDCALALVPAATAVVVAPLAGALVAASLVAALMALSLVARRGSLASRVDASPLADVPSSHVLHNWEKWKAGGRDDELLARLAGHHAAALSDRQQASVVHGHVAALRHGLAALALAAAVTLAPSDTMATLVVLSLLAHYPLAALQRALPDLAVLRHLLAVLDDSAAPEGSHPPPPRDEDGLVVDKLVFAPLPHELSLRVRPGQELGLTGPSGSGKTVLAQLTCGLLEPSGGQVRLDGMAVSALAPGQAAWVGRQVPVTEGSVADNLRLGDATLSDAALRQVLALVELDDELARRQGLDTWVEAGGQGLSGGQRRRLGLARALLRQPRLLVLDQCLDAVEPALDRRIRHRLRRHGLVLLTISDQPARLDECDLMMKLGETACPPAPS